MFGLSQLEPIGGNSATENEVLGLHGFDVDELKNSKLRFWLINHRAPVDVDKRVLDATKLGANSTVEVFEVIRGSNNMRHIKTIVNEAIATPNKLAATGDGGFLVTNDHSGKGEYIPPDFSEESPADDAVAQKLVWYAVGETNDQVLCLRFY